MKCVPAASVLLLFTAVGFSWGGDWTRFRGPDGAGTADDKQLPAEWSEDRNVVWRTELPGLGTSSPITLGDRAFLTCYSGYGIEPNEGQMEDLKRHLVCLDRRDGHILWTESFEPQLPESEYSGGNKSHHGYASSTPTTDGQRLYVFFGKSGVYCLDLDGNQLWHTTLGERTHGWGSGSSLLLYKDLLIVNASVESGALVALDKMTGREVWRKRGIRGAWNTPVLVETSGGQAELVISLPGQPAGKIVGLDPQQGTDLWHCDGIPDGGYVVPSVVAHEGIVYAIGGRQNTAIAVRAGGRGDVTESHLLWRAGKGSNVASPVYHEGHLYWIHEKRGIAFCLDATTGKVVYEERLLPRPGLTYSSATVADGKIYCVSQYEGTYVLAARPEFELLAHNSFADDNHRSNTPIVVAHGQLLFRNDRYLYCLAQE